MKKGFTVIELMVIILIVGILAAVTIPILKARIDAAKWSEGKTMMGSIAAAIRAYHEKVGPTGAPPLNLWIGDPCNLGFGTSDLDNTYFAHEDFTFDVSSMDPLKFTVSCTPTTKSNRPTYPPSYTLDQDGVFTP